MAISTPSEKIWILLWKTSILIFSFILESVLHSRNDWCTRQRTPAPIGYLLNIYYHHFIYIYNLIKACYFLIWKQDDWWEGRLPGGKVTTYNPSWFMDRRTTLIGSPRHFALYDEGSSITSSSAVENPRSRRSRARAWSSVYCNLKCFQLRCFLVLHLFAVQKNLVVQLNFVHRWREMVNIFSYHP